ncbi:MAG TPA: FtsX-like permease family protein, partial [Thermoanaerobaculia bacterium]|nr:FtsX-like permease family protein [Thermoanaerobaculia bacterium]
GELRAAIAGLDRQLPLFDIASLDERIARSLSRERFLTRLLMFFAAAALALAAVGIYSVLAYGVSRRRREIGIRMALGAGSESVLSWVFRQAGSAIVAGLAVGLAGSLSCSRLLAGQLFAVSPTDPATYAGVVALLAVVAAAASLLPARRAARVDPAVTLREE